ncbi:MAG TPA: MBL fold metallo-hydrolase [Acidimicrobiia bacterium]|nr:MBL fold metallo-hydrolase [Acidimicrobiia bacterium]
MMRRAATLAPIVDSIPEFVLHVSLETPFPVGPVNCYVLPGDPVTVVDPGLLYADSVQRLTELLARAGLGLGDVERVVVTHAHPDHFGMAAWVAEQADARILTGAPEIEKLVEGWMHDAMYAAVERLGVPSEAFANVPNVYAAVFEMVHPFGASPIDAVEDGEVLVLGGREWKAHVTPGHSKGHLSLFDPLDGVLLSGDHLLPQITPNPVMEPDPQCALGRRQSLVEYLATLDRFVALDPGVALPGHGPAFTGTPALAAAVRAHHVERAQEILAVVGNLGRPSAYEIAIVLFPDLRDFGMLLGVSEAVGHLDLLVEEGVVEREAGRPDRYQVKGR